MLLETFLQEAWRDHADDPLGVAGRLHASTHLITSVADFAPYARLVTHVFGEHLMHLNPGIALLESMRTLPVFDASPAAASPLARGIATLQFVSHVPGALDALSDEDSVCALAGASGIYLALNDIDLAVHTLQSAMDTVKPNGLAGSPAYRALAVCGNNLAAALEEKASRTPQQTQVMLFAAQAGLTYWKLAGTWLEEERAEYQLTRCLLQAGEAPAALQSAQRCLEVCERNEAPAFELFFANAMLALASRANQDGGGYFAHRTSALQQFSELSGEEQSWCKREVGELGTAAVEQGPV